MNNSRQRPTQLVQAPQQPFGLGLRLTLLLQILLMMAYPVLLLAVACILSIGAILQSVVTTSPSELAMLLPIAGGLYGVKAMATLLYATLIKPSATDAIDKFGLIAGVISCLSVIALGYDSVFIWLVFSLPIAAAIELLYLRQQQGLN